jgi:hypothetical protein
MPQLPQPPLLLLTLGTKLLELVNHGLQVWFKVLGLLRAGDDPHNVTVTAAVQVAEWHVGTPAYKGAAASPHNSNVSLLCWFGNLQCFLHTIKRQQICASSILGANLRAGKHKPCPTDTLAPPVRSPDHDEAT